MNPVLYRYRETESVIKQMDGYTPGAGWEPLYAQAEIDKLQAQLVRQQASYEAEIKVEIDAALERAAGLLDAHAQTSSGIGRLILEDNAAAIRALKENKE